MEGIKIMTDKTYTTDEMLYANKDELNWSKIDVSIRKS